MKKTILECDISDLEHAGEITNVIMPVIFDYDQEDGKSKCEPYMESQQFEMCQSCKKYMLKNRKYIYGYGAMGHNKYYLNY